MHKTQPEERRWDVFQAEIGYATQPRKDKRNNLFVSADVPDSQLGISAISLRCQALRDYFYVGDRRRGWDRQSSFYELLGVNPKVSPAELRLAFKLRTLELRTAHAPTGDLRALERAFNIVANPELRACYDTLLNDPASPALFPYGGFGSCLLGATAHATDRHFTPHASSRSYQNRSSNTFEGHCGTSHFTTATQSIGIHVANWKYSSATRPCRYRGT